MSDLGVSIPALFREEVQSLQKGGRASCGEATLRGTVILLRTQTCVRPSLCIPVPIMVILLNTSKMDTVTSATGQPTLFLHKLEEQQQQQKAEGIV